MFDRLETEAPYNGSPLSLFIHSSSVREPSQVFQLLETLYNAFDEIAGRRRVFKGMRASNEF